MKEPTSKHAAQDVAEIAIELRVDKLYRNTNNWKRPDDVFNKFFRFNGQGINNVAGFRPKSATSGSSDICDSVFVALVTNFDEPEWPDSLDRENGIFTYYGDNRSPGSITGTAVGGNRLLERVYHLVHTGARAQVPPFLVFQSVKKVEGMYMKFLGLACPGARGLSAIDDLVAVWRVKDQDRFQNYRSIFSILRQETVSREWLADLTRRVSPAASEHCPKPWREWVHSGRYDPLVCAKQRRPRTKVDQLPANSHELAVLSYLLEQFTDREFEFAARDLVQWMDNRFTDLEVTRPTKDGGRDVIAKYRVGHDLHQVMLEAYIEAKRWNPSSSVGVKPMMRLISRIKHRDMGVFITTSFFDQQVQQELIADAHPVLLLSGGDIARLLISKELGDVKPGGKLATWVAAVKQATAQPAAGTN